jgi:hypothetical protein
LKTLFTRFTDKYILSYRYTFSLYCCLEWKVKFYILRIYCYEQIYLVYFHMLGIVEWEKRQASSNSKMVSILGHPNWRVFSVYCHFKRFYMRVFSFKIHYVWYFNLQNNSTKFYHFVFLHSWVKLSVHVRVVPVRYHSIEFV